MRLLSFFNKVEITLAMLKPEYASGWKRRADYQMGAATCWHDQTGLALNIHSSDLGNGRFSLQACWADQTGHSLFNHTYFCGASQFDWQSAADAVAEAMPDPVEIAQTSTQEPSTLRAAVA